MHIVLYEAMNPKAELYTRQQIAQLTGIDSSSLNYWSREGLLVPTEGGLGSGSYRRFDFVQVNIAAVFGQLKRFGINIAALRSLADLLQSAAALGAAHSLHPSSYSRAAWLANRLDQFRRGEDVLISPRNSEPEPEGLHGRALSDWLSMRRPAASENEILQETFPFTDDYDPQDRVVAAAETMGPGKEKLANLYADLVYGILAPGYSGGYSWLLALNDNNTWRVAFGDEAKFFDTINSESPEDFGSGLFLPVSGIFRNVWKLKTAAEYRRERDAGAVTDMLAAAGIEATVTIRGDEGEILDIDAPGVDDAAIEAALKRTRFAFASKD